MRAAHALAQRLGQAGYAVAGSAVWISFFLGGIIALLTGYSYGKLGARYPSAGGVVEFLTQEYGVGVFSGGVSILYYLSQVIGTSEHRRLQATTYQPKAPSRSGNGADPLSKEQ